MEAGRPGHDEGFHRGVEAGVEAGAELAMTLMASATFRALEPDTIRAVICEAICEALA